MALLKLFEAVYKRVFQFASIFNKDLMFSFKCSILNIEMSSTERRWNEKKVFKLTSFTLNIDAFF